MEKAKTIIIGGGASALILATLIDDCIILERNDRVGKKLSATGNGQGNITNKNVSIDKYFSDDKKIVKNCIESANEESCEQFYSSVGILPIADDRGRVYPSSKQASSIVDMLRFKLKDKKIYLSTLVVSVEKKNAFTVKAKTPDGEKIFTADNVVIATGGKAYKSFGTDGNGYELAKSFGHSVTALYPSLVQLKTRTEHIKTLRNLRVNVRLTANTTDKEFVGDLLFNDCGVSGDTVFRISPYVTDKKNVQLHIDLLPDISEQRLVEILKTKQKTGVKHEDILCGILHNQIGRAVIKRANGQDVESIAKTVKDFSLEVEGTTGFDNAQVTKGGVPLKEVTENLESKKVKGIYFTGEILNVDGECGGYNLQWAYSSAVTVARAINSK